METQQKVLSTNSVFAYRYLDNRAMYLYCFNSIPCITFVGHIDGEKAFHAVKEKYPDLVQSVHSYRAYRRRKIKSEFEDTLVVLNNECILEFDTGYCEILHSYGSGEFINEIQLPEPAYKIQATNDFFYIYSYLDEPVFVKYKMDY